MEKQILEILKAQSYNEYQGILYVEETAKEITDHIFEFIKWRSSSLGRNTETDKEIEDDYINWSKPKMIPVTSSQIKSVGYKDSTLYIEFMKATYSYKGVPESLFLSLRFAKSPGSFFSSEIKGKYEYEKV